MPDGQRGKTRRALTQARRPAPVRLSGDPDVARALGRALDLRGAGDEQQREFTHGFHGYPARMHPLTARRALVALRIGPGATVLDPFCGSGTVLVEAVRAGALALGVDASPLAVRIARTKVWAATAARRRELVERARRIAALVVAEGKAARRAGWEPPPPRPLPPGVSRRERDERLRGWFDPHLRREVEALAAAVADEPDEELREVLLTVLSSVLMKVSRRESDTSARQVVRRLGRGMAARLFAARAEELVQGLDALSRVAPPGTPKAAVRLGDARALDEARVAPGSITAIVTSPPYAGTYDYLEQHALRLAFLGLPQGAFAAREIGARRAFAGPAARVRAALAEWDADFGAALAAMANVLVPRGRAVLNVGDSLAGAPPAAVAVHADDVVARLAPAAGLAVRAAASQEREALGGGERSAFATRPKREHLILLEKR